MVQACSKAAQRCQLPALLALCSQKAVLGCVRQGGSACPQLPFSESGRDSFRALIIGACKVAGGSQLLVEGQPVCLGAQQQLWGSETGTGTGGEWVGLSRSCRDGSGCLSRSCTPSHFPHCRHLRPEVWVLRAAGRQTRCMHFYLCLPAGNKLSAKAAGGCWGRCWVVSSLCLPKVL